jgi:hypothetical protein
MKDFLLKNGVILILLFLFSCEEKEKPNNAIGNISITGIQLIDPTVFPSGRITTGNVWKHDFQNEITILFESSGGESFNLKIQPNDFRAPYTISLPVGVYSVSSERVAQLFSEVLPIHINQEINVSPGLQSLNLQATSDFGLFSITNRNLGSKKPELISSVNQLAQRADFYYIYAQKGQNLTIQIHLSDNESFFRSNWKLESFTHRHLNLSKSTQPSEKITFAPTDFKLNQESIALHPNGIPMALTPTVVADLPASQNETSGLAYIQNKLFSINDGGNSNEIFELNPETGEVLRSIKVKNAINIDWEDLAQSDTHLFIGDFGNNGGTRKDLAILKIRIADLLANMEVEATRLSFTYSDQTDFSGNGGNHNFDCEAFFFWENSLHLFSKNRLDQKTKHYILDPNSSSTVAMQSGIFDADGLITAASISLEGNIILLGYQDLGLTSKSFVWLFSNYSGHAFFSGKANQITLGSPIFLSQTEGIAFVKDGGVFITGERIAVGNQGVPARISKIDFTGLF